MALSQAAHLAEKAIGHGKNEITSQDESSYPYSGAGDSDMMNALVWMGKNKVEIVRVPKPKIMEARDVILKVTGTTVCGSDLHLLHGTVMQLAKGNILGHEFCGVAEMVASQVHNVTVGKRYVASFQIACGDCYYCKQKLSSQCEKTNSNTINKAQYGGRTAGMFGYSHLTGGFAGGQAEYVRVPLGDVNLLELPDDVPDEKGLFLSDVLSTSYHCVKDGAQQIIFVGTEPRLSCIRRNFPAQHQNKLTLVDYKKLSSGITSSETVVSQLQKICGNRGPDVVALECAAGEYAKGWLHWLEMATGVETDTSEILNEMIEGVRSYGRCGITGVYVGYTNHFNVGSLTQRGIRLIGNGQAPVH